jgi:hypothetical protein
VLLQVCGSNSAVSGTKVSTQLLSAFNGQPANGTDFESFILAMAAQLTDIQYPTY